MTLRAMVVFPCLTSLAVTNRCPIYARKQPRTSIDKGTQKCPYPWGYSEQAETAMDTSPALTRRTKLCHGLRTTPTAARSSVGMRHRQCVLREILSAL